MSQALVEFKNCDLGYGSSVILSHLQFHIHTGEFVALVGPNGSGKTTLLKSLLGLHRPLNGQVTVAAKKIGYVPQQTFLNLNVPMTGNEFFELKNIKLDADILKKILGDDYKALLAKPLQSLSSGQRQRVLIAFSLLNEPDLICLDEATDGLDFKAQNDLFHQLKEIQKKTGAAVLLVSHDISAVGDYASRVVCLNRSVLFDGDPKSPEFHTCLHSIYGKESFIHNHHHHGH